MDTKIKYEDLSAPYAEHKPLRTLFSTHLSILSQIHLLVLQDHILYMKIRNVCFKKAFLTKYLLCLPPNL